MRILVDADACPVKEIIGRVAREDCLKLVFLCDTNHMIESEYGAVQVMGAGPDAVDYALMERYLAKEAR